MSSRPSSVAAATHKTGGAMGLSSSSSGPAVIDRHVASLLQKHHQSAVTTESFLRCPELLAEALDGVGRMGSIAILAHASEPEERILATATSLLTFVLASSSTTQYTPADLQHLLAPVSTSSLRPTSLLLLPAMLFSWVHLEHHRMLRADEEAQSSVSARVLLEAVVSRVYLSMCSAMARHHALVSPDRLPFPLGSGQQNNLAAGGSTTQSGAGGSARSADESWSGGGTAAAGPPAGNATTLTTAALRDGAALASVYSLPPCATVTPETAPVMIFASLCGFSYLLYNVLHTRTPELDRSTTVRAFAQVAAATLRLFNHPLFVDLIRRDSALMSVTVSILQVLTPVLRSSTGLEGESGSRTSSAAPKQALLLDAVLQRFALLCFSYDDHTFAAAMLLPLLRW